MSEVPQEFQDDAIARKTSWEPLLPKDGANYRTRSIEPTEDDRLVFVPSFTSKLIIWAVFGFSAISLLIGSVVTYLWLSGAADMNDGEGDVWILRFVGPGFVSGALLFAGVGVYLKKKLLRLVVFDKELGCHWKGSRQPTPATRNGGMELNQIHALQVIQKWIKPSGPDSGGYFSFELNLVSNDGERKNVIDHGDHAGLLEDAGILAEYLDKPLWDATGEDG